VPELLVTDNGSDFTSRHFVDVVRRLGITHRLCAVGQPQQKAAVERMIGTIQHEFMELQPGYIGHSVTDRKQIEARRSFLNRLGQPDEKLFCVELTRDQLQARIAEWIEQKWVHDPHEGLGGKTPFEVRHSYRGSISRIEGDGVLEQLLAPPPDGDGVRTVTSKGVRVENIHYTHGALGLLVGQDDGRGDRPAGRKPSRVLSSTGSSVQGGGKGDRQPG
jgi:transposase InsO family protein